MKKKINKKIIMGILLTVAITVGGVGTSVIAAGTYSPVTVKSYGTYIYDDGNADNNNGHQYDLYLDASDITGINNNLDALKGNIDTNLNVKVDHWDADTQSLYLVPVE